MSSAAHSLFSHLDGKIRIGFSGHEAEEESSEKEREREREREREADNFWHESHKTLRGEQIINSNSTKKMAAAAFAVDDGDGDAVATNSPRCRLSHSENMYVHMRYDAHREKERRRKK